VTSKFIAGFLAVAFGVALSTAIVLGIELRNTNKKLVEVMTQPPEVVEKVEYIEVETICPECANDCNNLYLGVDEKYLFVYNAKGEPVAFWERHWSDTTLK
jgi:hypothetical protein